MLLLIIDLSIFVVVVVIFVVASLFFGTSKDLIRDSQRL